MTFTPKDKNKLEKRFFRKWNIRIRYIIFESLITHEWVISLLLAHRRLRSVT